MLKLGPSLSSKTSKNEWTRNTAKPEPGSRPSPAPDFGGYKSDYTSSVIINGKKISGFGKGGTYIKNGVILEPGTEEYKTFKSEMDEFGKEMTNFGVEMAKMGQDMATSASDAAKNVRKAFHDKD